MKKELTEKLMVAVCGVLITFPANAVLSLSDAPMFVTETLAPNVIISPVYGFDSNEISLMDVPLAEYLVCLGTPIEGINCIDTAGTEDAGETVTRDAWSRVWDFPQNQYGMRVTPWPGAYKTATNKLYSNITVYPLDILIYPGTEIIEPLYYGKLPLIGEINKVREEVYPGAGAAYENDTNKGKLRYFRSNKNFLYFNPTVASLDLDGGMDNGYQPWPQLESYPATPFPVYDITSAVNPYYNPLKKQHSAAGDMQASVAAAGVNWIFAHPLVGADSVVQLNNDIGQYWDYKAAGVGGSDGKVWKSTSYQGYTWATMPDDATRINFAHWFTYWRSSYLATRGILANLIHEMGPANADILGRFRVGISYDGSIGHSGGVGVKAGTSAEITNALAPIIYNFNTNFTNWDHNNTTAYYGTPDAYRDDPGDSNSTIRSCRRNYEIVVTPDYTRLRRDGTTSIGTIGNQDSSMGTPYADNMENQWADVGAYGWKTDLMLSLDNTLLPGVRDSQTQQHLVRYVIGPKAKGNIFPDSVAGFSAADSIFNAQTAATWQASFDAYAGSALMQYTIDDLWHMALNSRGFFYTSDNVQDTVQKLLDAFNDVLVRSVSGSAVATNTTSLQLGGRVYQATVETDWKGHLRAYNIAPNADNTALVLDFSAPVWDLAEKVSAVDWGDRKILTWNGSTGVPFRWANIGTPAQNLLKTAVPGGVDANDYGGKLLEYLRGSGTCENDVTTACTAGGPYAFRRRNLERSNFTAYSAANPNGRNVLGDIANSNPWLTTAPTAGLSDVDYPGYNSHRTTHKTRGDVLYVGANDGMLHAVDAGTTVANQGKELFAYIPSFVQADLYRLGQSNYDHRYFVDGSPFSAEAQIGSDWKTVLAGGANKGGKGYYLLDVTNVGKATAVTEADAASIVLWEFTGSPDLHFTYNLPIAYPLPNGQARQIARMNDGKWALIVGNGYPDAADKKACLFILYLSGPGAAADTGGAVYHGTGYHKLCAGATTYLADGGLDSNGLSTPTPVDTNGDKKVDVIYAGDLNGNMWRFDVSSATAADWAVAYSVFVAKNAADTRQPIIAPPEVMPYTYTKDLGTASGQLLLFGTGKFIEGSDRTNADVQTFYGVWDRGFADLSPARGSQDSKFVSQSDYATVTGTDTTYTYRSQSTWSEVKYCTADALSGCVGKHLGWYWDMPDAGERLTGRVSLISGTVLFNTFYPLLSGGVLDPCQYGGDGWLMGLDAVTGRMVDLFPVFDINRDGNFNISDPKAAGVKVGAALGGTTFARGIGDAKVGIYSPTNMGTNASEGSKMTTTVNVPPGSTGRVSWYELMD